MRVLLKFLFAALLIAPAGAHAGTVERLVIGNYAGEAMEPFVSRDGRFLFFNTRNDPGVDTNIHFAELKGRAYVYRGVLPGSVSNALDGTPTMSGGGRFCFISTRDYFKTLVTVNCGAFKGNGLADVRPQSDLAGERVGRLTFDVDLSADGNTLVFAEGTFSGGAVPDDADLHFARWSEGGFQRDPGRDRLLSRVNTADLEYAPALSVDGLELYFTRMTGFWIFRSAHIFVARRAGLDQAFGDPVELKQLDGFVEGPTLAPDGSLIFHKRVDDRYELWRWVK